MLLCSIAFSHVSGLILSFILSFHSVCTLLSHAENVPHCERSVPIKELCIRQLFDWLVRFFVNLALFWPRLCLTQVTEPRSGSQKRLCQIKFLFITPKRVTRWRGPFPRFYAGQHSFSLRSGDELLATLCPIWLARDLNLRPPAPKTNALLFDLKFRKIIFSSFAKQPRSFEVNFCSRGYKVRGCRAHYHGMVRSSSLIYFNKNYLHYLILTGHLIQLLASNVKGN